MDSDTINAPRRRRRRLLRRFDKAGIDALLVTSPANVRYLSGFTGEDSYLLVGPGWAVLLTDGRFETQSAMECHDIERHVRRGKMLDAITRSLVGRSARRVGVEADHMTVGAFDKLVAALGKRRVRSTEGLTAGLRMQKDPVEIVAIRKAARAAQKAFRQLLAQGRGAFVGRTERQVAAKLEYGMSLAGVSGPSFPTIVAAGPHAALPHYRPGSWRIRAGQPVLIDWGAVVDGYCSDLTRVVFTGRIPPQIGRIYELVLRAQQVGIDAVKAGRSARAVDAAARQVIEAGGFGDKFGHGLGHGVGLEIHESPGLSRLAEGRLRAGQVVTVEPGIYLPGVGGVRIEDDVLVEVGGATVLTSLPKSVRAMILK